MSDKMSTLLVTEDMHITSTRSYRFPPVQAAIIPKPKHTNGTDAGKGSKPSVRERLSVPHAHGEP